MRLNFAKIASLIRYCILYLRYTLVNYTIISHTKLGKQLYRFFFSTRKIPHQKKTSLQRILESAVPLYRSYEIKQTSRLHKISPHDRIDFGYMFIYSNWRRNKQENEIFCIVGRSVRQKSREENVIRNTARKKGNKK